MALKVEDLFKAIDNLCAFPRHSNIAVAVSGGSDSLAIMLILNIWCKARGHTLYALHVNHGIREESVQEMTFVESICANYGIAYQGFHLHNLNKITAKLQETARDMRYDALTSWCANNKCIFLFTGHHKNDQEETIHMRLKRPCNLIGQAGISALSIKHNVFILRPMLNLSKDDIRAFLKQHFKISKYVEDPSNYSDKYERSNIRKDIKYSAINNILPIEKFGRERCLLEQESGKILSRELKFYHPIGVVTFKDSMLNNDIKFVSYGISKVIQAISGSSVTWKKVTPLIDALQDNKVISIGRMIAYKNKGSLVMHREARDRDLLIDTKCKAIVNIDKTTQIALIEEFNLSSIKYLKMLEYNLVAQGRSPCNLFIINNNLKRSYFLPSVPWLYKNNNLVERWGEYIFNERAFINNNSGVMRHLFKVLSYQ